MGHCLNVKVQAGPDPGPVAECAARVFLATIS